MPFLREAATLREKEDRPVKKILDDFLHMCPAAWSLVAGTLRLSCAVGLCALAFLLEGRAGGSCAGYFLAVARELADLPAGLLTIAFFGALGLEELSRR